MVAAAKGCGMVWNGREWREGYDRCGELCVRCVETLGFAAHYVYISGGRARLRRPFT